MDESLTRRLVAAVADQAQAFGFGFLSEPEKGVVMAWWAVGVISNGGFECLYQCEHDIPSAIRRIRTVGLTEIASACEQVAAALRGGKVPVDEDQRCAWAATIDWDQFEAQEAAIHAVPWSTVLAAIGEYVERNRGEFVRAMTWAAGVERGGRRDT